MGLSRSLSSGSYWNSTAQHNITQGSALRWAGAWSKVLGRDQKRAKGANLFLAKQYQLHISNARKGIVLWEDNSSLYEPSVRKLASEKYLWVEGVFLAASQYSWQCEHVLCLGAIDTSNKYVGTVCIWKQLIWDISHRCLVSRSEIGSGKKK